MEDEIKQLYSLINILQNNITHIQEQINQLYDHINDIETKYIITQ